ncbi:MAG: hypothetical protein KBD37_04275 [Burkholderiales bacterium]|nr:hypothetical protein [Burkholderiales bacterium]
MKNLLLSALLGLSFVGSAIADNQMPDANMQPQMDPTCKPAMDHMQANHQKVMAAIKANNPMEVGNLVIAGHKYMENFVAKNPQCKPKSPMMMSAPMADNNK